MDGRKEGKERGRGSRTPDGTSDKGRDDRRSGLTLDACRLTGDDDRDDRDDRNDEDDDRGTGPLVLTRLQLTKSDEPWRGGGR